MDCILGPTDEWQRLDGRPVSAVFHFAEIRQALQFIRGASPAGPEASELDAACSDALKAIASLSVHFTA